MALYDDIQYTIEMFKKKYGSYPSLIVVSPAEYTELSSFERYHEANPNEKLKFRDIELIVSDHVNQFYVALRPYIDEHPPYFTNQPWRPKPINASELLTLNRNLR